MACCLLAVSWSEWVERSVGDCVNQHYQYCGIHPPATSLLRLRYLLELPIQTDSGSQSTTIYFNPSLDRASMPYQHPLKTRSSNNIAIVLEVNALWHKYWLLFQFVMSIAKEFHAEKSDFASTCTWLSRLSICCDWRDSKVTLSPLGSVGRHSLTSYTSSNFTRITTFEMR